MLKQTAGLSVVLLVVSFFPLFVFAKSYPNNTLIRVKGDPRVYLIKNNQKEWIKSLEEFKVRKLNWKKVKIISLKEFDAIEEKVSGLPTPTSAITPLPSIALREGGLPSPSVSVSASIPPAATPIPAKINPQLPAPDYIRADWLVSQATAKYGQIGQKIVFKYSDKTVDRIENFRLYEKKPNDQYFSKIADFKEVLSTGCEDIDIDGEWMITEAAPNQCGYWAIQRVLPPGGRELTAYRSAGSYSEGEYHYYVVGMDKDGLETPPSSTSKLVFLTTVGIFEPTNQAVTGSFPKFRWSVAGGWPSSAKALEGGPLIDYLILISDNQNAQNPLWTKVIKVPAGQSDRTFIYDGAGLNPAKKYQLYIYGRYRASEHDPDYISISLTVPEFTVVRLSRVDSWWGFLRALLFKLPF